MKESEIRPKEFFDKYLELTMIDVKSYFSNKERFEEVPCPGCHSYNETIDFEKDGFNFKKCSHCSTLYCSPRPCQKDIDLYYSESKSSEYWATTFYKKTEKARREKLVKPKVKTLIDILKQYNVTSGSLVDIGAGYGTFCEELIASNYFNKVTALEPSAFLSSACFRKGINVIESTIEGVNSNYYGNFDIAVALELIEHVYSVDIFLQNIIKVLKPGGILLFTTLSSTGWDILNLDSFSKNIYGPCHLNILNPEAVSYFAKRNNMKVIDIFTPGKLDVDIVRNSQKENPELKLTDFALNIINSSDKTKNEFQTFLANNKMSSHMWCILQKKKDI